MSARLQSPAAGILPDGGALGRFGLLQGAEMGCLQLGQNCLSARHSGFRNRDTSMPVESSLYADMESGQ